MLDRAPAAPGRIQRRDLGPTRGPDRPRGPLPRVGPEELVGFLTALEGFLAEDHEATLDEWRERAERIADGLDDCRYLNVHLSSGRDKASGVPKVIARVREEAPLSAVDLIRALRREDPRVWVGERRVHLEEFTVAPQELDDDEATYLVERTVAQFD